MPSVLNKNGIICLFQDFVRKNNQPSNRLYLNRVLVIKCKIPSIIFKRYYLTLLSSLIILNKYNKLNLNKLNH